MGAGAARTASEVEEGDRAAAVFDAWGADGIGGSEVDDAVDDVSALNGKQQRWLITARCRQLHTMGS